MDLTLITDLNYLAILISAAAYWILGALWYSPVLFGKTWQKLVNLTEDDRKGMGKAMILSFIGFFLMCMVLAIIMARIQPEIESIMGGIKLGALAGIGFVLISYWITSIYNKTSFILVIINGFYHVVGLIIAGVILSMM